MEKPTQPKSGRRRWKLVAATTVVVVLAAGAAVWRSRGQPPAEMTSPASKLAAQPVQLGRALPIAAKFLRVPREKLAVMPGQEPPFATKDGPTLTPLTVRYIGTDHGPVTVTLTMDIQAGCVVGATWHDVHDSRPSGPGHRPLAELRRSAEQFLAGRNPVPGAREVPAKDFGFPRRLDVFHTFQWDLVSAEGKNQGHVQVVVVSASGRLREYRFLRVDPLYGREPVITRPDAIGIAAGPSASKEQTLRSAELTDRTLWTHPGWPVWQVSFDVRERSPDGTPKSRGQTVWVDAVTGKVLHWDY